MFLRKLLIILIMVVLKFGSFFFVTLWSFMVHVFGFISKLIHRLKIEKDANFHPNSVGFEETGEDEKTESFETEDSVFKKKELVLSENKYEFLLSEDLKGFLFNPQGISFTVEEMFVDSNDDVFLSKNKILDDQFQEHIAEMDDQFQENIVEIDVQEKVDEALDEKIGEVYVLHEAIQETIAEIEDQFQENIGELDVQEKVDEALDEKIGEVYVLDEAFQETIAKIDDQFQENVAEIDVHEKVDEALDEKIGEVYVLDEAIQETIAEIDDFKKEDFDVEENDEETEETTSLECESLKHHEDTETFEISLQQIEVFCKDQDSIFHRKLDSDGFVFDDDFTEIKPCNQPQDGYDDFGKSFSINQDYKLKESYEAHGAQKFEEDNSGKSSWGLDSGEEDEVDILKQHQDLVQQMKMEMRYAKVKGLPTISEDCESPKSVEDMKPLRIDDKFEFKDCIAEIQKFYKSYAERMRKLDILNYQKLHAISFLQLKDSEVFMAGHKSSNSVTKPFIPKFWPCKMQRIYADSTHKLLSETHQDLELVYIGQICHSWEILNWQYAKAKELLENDSQGYHSYNKVASEFQQFQVLMERFVEDEPFQGNGDRIQHYVKNRCVLRTLLHVPVIKDDCFQDKKAVGGEQENMISVTELAKIIRQSMEIFWEFLSCEKGESKMIQKAAQVSEVDIHDPEHAKLLMDTKLTLQQKERRLKEILRSGNCIVKKFQKGKKNGQNHALFTSQVELKLVSRVLSFSRITRDQSMWCRRKLDNISFSGRKVHVEPSFWLFPC